MAGQKGLTTVAFGRGGGPGESATASVRARWSFANFSTFAVEPPRAEDVTRRDRLRRGCDCLPRAASNVLRNFWPAKHAISSLEINSIGGARFFHVVSPAFPIATVALGCRRRYLFFFFFLIQFDFQFFAEQSFSL